MQTIETNDEIKPVDFSRALSAFGNDLARYPALATHAADFSSVAHDLLFPPVVVVMGAFNAGKSTLLNALLGQNLLNMHVLPATATVTMLCRGNAGKIYGHANGQPIRTWPVSKLASLSAEGDAEAVAIRQSLSYIEVPLEVKLLDRVTLVDTPGLNSPNEAHTRATEEFVQRSHAVLWIVSCLQPLNEQERSWIERLPDGVKVMVVVNQIDQLDPEEDSLSRVIERIKNNLRRPDLTVTAVSAKLALESRLEENPNAYASSLWDKFIADFNSRIIESDHRPQLLRLVNKVAALFDSLDADIAGYLAEADALRIKAKGGNEYHQDLQRRISALAAAEHSLVHAPDALVAVQQIEIAQEWNIPDELKLKREVLIGALIAFEAGQTQLGYEQALFKEKCDQIESDYRQLKSEAEQYMKSGLFGGEPIIFDGKKKKLENREKRIVTRSDALLAEQETLRAKQNSSDARKRRVENDFSAFVDEIVAAIRGVMAAVVRESHDTVGQQKIAGRQLEDMKWLPTFASKVRQASYWRVPERDDATSYPDGLNAALGRFKTTIDTVLERTWGISIPNPLVEPAASTKQLSYERTVPSLRVQPGAVSRSFWIVAGLAAILLIVFFTMRHAPQHLSRPATVEAEQPKPSAMPIPVAPTDDYTAIRASLAEEGYVADGAIADVPGITPEAALHAQKVSCSGVKQPCEKLFVFVGPRAVWSEDLTSSDALSNVTVSGPGQFDVQVKRQLPDGTEASVTTKYKWDGATLARTRDDTNTETPSSPEATTGGQAVTVPQSASPVTKAPEVIVPTADAANQQGIAFANARQYDLAIASFNQGIERDGGRADLYNNRGAMFANKGDNSRAIADYDQALRLNSNYPQALDNRGNAYAQLGDYNRAIADYDKAIRLNPNFTEAINSRNMALLRQTQQAQGRPQNQAQSYTPSTQSNPYSNPAVARTQSAYTPRSAQGTSYDDIVQSAQNALQRRDLRGAYRLATQARDLSPDNLPALELMQVILAQGGDSNQAESAALDAIRHGGKAVFELQHFHAWPTNLHAARLIITATTLEFVPEAPCKYGDFTIPLTTIKSVEMGENTLNVYLLNIKFDDSHEKTGKGKEAKGQISFTDSSSRLDNSSSAYHVSSQRSVSQETALFSAIRNVILNAKGRL
jgi:small GTP-binding protein